MAIQRLNPAQMAFDLDLDETADDAAERVVSPAEARQICEAARSRFVDGERPLWFDDYLQLIQAGWPWRVAAYIAWSSAPKASREPKTLEKLAEMLGLNSPRAIHKWRQKYPAIGTLVALMQAQPLFEHRRDFIEALITSASSPDYKGFNDRKLAFEMMRDFTPRSQIKLENGKASDEAEMSDEELRALKGSEDDDGPDADPIGEPVA